MWSIKAFFLPGLAVIACAGCISIGSEMATPAAYEQIVEGKTTPSQAFEILGKPSSTTRSSEGVTIYGWSRTSAGPLSEKVEITIITLEYHGSSLVRKAMTTTEA
jgi:hypothetical protein